MQTTWILVADSSRARIFEMRGARGNLREIDDFFNPHGRANNRELRTDGYGRYYGKGEREQAHTAEPHVDAVQQETELFAKTLDQYIDKARGEHRYDQLHLIAPPKFLGLIRENLSKEAQKLVVEEIPKEVSHFEPKEIEDYLKNRKK